MGNQKPYIEEKKTTQWPKEKVKKDKQRSTKHTYKTKERVTQTTLKPGGELRYEVYLYVVRGSVVVMIPCLFTFIFGFVL